MLFELIEFRFGGVELLLAELQGFGLTAERLALGLDPGAQLGFLDRFDACPLELLRLVPRVQQPAD